MKKAIRWGIGIAFLVAAIGGGGFAYYEYQLWNSPWGEADERYLIDIPEGKSATQIAEMLHEKGVIPSVSMFTLIADLRGIGDSLKAGEYEFTGDQTPYQALNLLAIGWNYRRSLVIPEGFTQLQIAQRCEEMEICSADAFIEQSNGFTTFSAVVTSPDGTNAANEGVFFPDTYFLIRNTPAIKVTERMVRRFNEKFKEIYDEATADDSKVWWWQEGDSVYNEQVHKIVILASIIEKEARKDENRAKIASVFVNRLKKNMPLQSDATIHYALQDWSGSLLLKDLEVDSPYNTYKRKGLPPAAICNPGYAALKAAAMPAETDYLYFISMPDGEVKFTGDYDEFLANKREYKQAKRELAE